MPPPKEADLELLEEAQLTVETRRGSTAAKEDRSMLDMTAVVAKGCKAVVAMVKEVKRRKS